MAAFSTLNARAMDSRFLEVETAISQEAFFGLNHPHDATASLISSPLSALDTFEDFHSDSFFPSPIDSALPTSTILGWQVQHGQIGIDERSYLPPAFDRDAPAFEASIPFALPTPLPALHTRNIDQRAIGDRLYGIQQTTSPTIVVTSQPPPTLKTEVSGQFLEEDFVERQAAFIYLQPVDDHAISLEFIVKVRQGYKVQHAQGYDHMHSVRALRIAIATTMSDHSENPPLEHELLDFLRQGLAAGMKEDTQPILIDGIGPDRPLAVPHLLMMLHRYGLRSNRHYNIGIIRPLPTSSDIGTRTYSITLEGPKTQGAKTVWVYENGIGAWSPIAPDDFLISKKTYAEAVKSEPVVQRHRAISSVSASNGFLHPDRYQLSTSSRTVSESGSEGTTVSCKSCGKSFAHEGEMKQHTRNHRHRTHDCPTCHKKFLWEKDLKRHERTHKDKGQRLDYKCDVRACGKAYTRRDNLNRHLRLDHPAWLPHPQQQSR